MTLKLFPAIAVTAALLAAQSGREKLLQVKAVRHWSLTDATRVAVEVSGEFQYHTERLHNPERIFFDVFASRPVIESRVMLNRELDDKILKKIRIAETLPGVTRIVLDLQSNAEMTATQLSNPNRLMIELRPMQGRTVPLVPQPGPLVSEASAMPTPATVTAEAPAVGAPGLAAAPKWDGGARNTARSVAAVAPPAPSVEKPAYPLAVKPEDAPRVPSQSSRPAAAKKTPPPERLSEPKAEVAARLSGKSSQPVSAGPNAPLLPEKETEPANPTVAIARDLPPTQSALGAVLKPEASTAAVPPSKAASRTSTGRNSLIRALGLKLTRVVLDPGHGGHDQGTVGPKGLTEKELVLDVSKRLAELIEERMGAEVVFTRTDDTFVPLEGRTALANEKKADLFLSIHANSSQIPRISGVETFYLNFTESKDALDVASRENASSQKSIFELRDLIQKITAHDKAEESREFAGRIQASLYSFSARSAPAARNRGVKKAPFIVLIGATMPSVLAEIGFLSNAREEALLKKPDYRQKLAEALYRGLSKYAESLSHFQVAKNE